MRVFITGGTGLIGSRLVRQLLEQQDQVVVLTRRPAAARATLGTSCTLVEGDPVQPGPWMHAVADCDAAVHLAGENLFARRWNDAFKAQLRSSRLRSTELVVQALARQPRAGTNAAKVLVSASAIGWYGPRNGQELDEASPAGDDFLARLCVDWEQAARAGETSGLRVALIRIGVVLAKEGGALAKMLTPFRLGAGGPIGSGNQWVSWIHHADLVGIFRLALDRPDALGPINGTAPQPVTNRQLSQALGRTLHRPAFLPTPALALRLALGEVAQLITTGQRVLPRKALALGYSFRFADIDTALHDILG